MAGPFKMKGSPMYRNFGIGSPAKDTMTTGDGSRYIKHSHDPDDPKKARESGGTTQNEADMHTGSRKPAPVKQEDFKTLKKKMIRKGIADETISGPNKTKPNLKRSFGENIPTPNKPKPNLKKSLEKKKPKKVSYKEAYKKADKNKYPTLESFTKAAEDYNKKSRKTTKGFSKSYKQFL